MSTPKLQYEKLHKDDVCKQEYTVAVENEFTALESIGESKWKTFKEAPVSTAKEVIPKKRKMSTRNGSGMKFLI